MTLQQKFEEIVKAGLLDHGCTGEGEYASIARVGYTLGLSEGAEAFAKFQGFRGIPPARWQLRPPKQGEMVWDGTIRRICLCPHDCTTDHWVLVPFPDVPKPASRSCNETQENAAL